MKILLNEKEYAEQVLNNKHLDKKPTFDLRILAKYYRWVEGLTQHKIYLKLVSLMEEKYNDFSIAKWQDMLLNLSKQSKKYKLIEINYIPVTKNELLTIDDIQSKPMKRLAFTLLCLAKYRNEINPNNNDWLNYKFKDIFKMSNINFTKKEQGFIIYDMKAMGLIKMNKMVDNLSINVCYIDKTNSDEVLQIKDFRNLGYEYLLYSGEKFIRCEECGILVRQNKQNNRIYCTECNKYIPQETKTITCIEPNCGKEVEIDAWDMKTCRCKECQDIRDKETKKERNKRYYQKKSQN